MNRIFTRIASEEQFFIKHNRIPARGIWQRFLLCNGKIIWHYSGDENYRYVDEENYQYPILEELYHNDPLIKAERRDSRIDEILTN